MQRKGTEKMRKSTLKKILDDRNKEVAFYYTKTQELRKEKASLLGLLQLERNKNLKNYARFLREKEIKEKLFKEIENNINLLKAQDEEIEILKSELGK